MNRRVVGLVIAVMAVACLPLMAGASLGSAIRVQGTATHGDDEGIFAGAFLIQQFALQGNQIVAQGTLSVSTAIKGNVLTRSTAFTAPVSIVRGSCEAVELEVGPFDLMPPFPEMTLHASVDKAKVTINQSMVSATPEGTTQAKDALCGLASRENNAQTVAHLNTLLKALP